MSQNNTVDLYYLFSSSTAGLVARTITHPMDTIKTRLQIINTTSKTFSIRNLVFPLSTLYRGLPVTLAFSVPALSVYLSCYESSKQTLEHYYHVSRDSAISHLISGCVAEVSAGALFTPMEVMKNRLQTQALGGTLRLAQSILETEGIKGFFRGYWMGLVVFVPHSMAYFAVYEKMKKWMGSGTSQNYLLSSTVAGISSIILSTPLDIIKTRWQISAAENGKLFRKGPLAIAKDMIRNEGHLAFTRGLWARIIWGIPTTAISMTIFELLKDNRNTFSS
ncbi:mitochondrial carrier domain-containing protein [Sporodiniella umbellata]|nr:mitochondrial carrier domain-containing protein [Sporodiniella umbellata]